MATQPRQLHYFNNLSKKKKNQLTLTFPTQIAQKSPIFSLSLTKKGYAMNQQPLPPADGEVTLHTSLGDVIVELWSKEAPRAVRNFVQLCLNQSYERCQFHTVKKDVLIQTGDPTNTGSGGASSTPGTPIPCEPAKKLKLSTRGMVAMPGGDAGEIGSQFFITLQPVPALQGNVCESINSSSPPPPPPPPFHPGVLLLVCGD